MNNLYQFTLILDGVDEKTPGLEDVLFEVERAIMSAIKDKISLSSLKSKHHFTSSHTH